MKTIKIGNTTGVVINGTVHVLKRSTSRYHLRANGAGGQYCCLGSCCDGGLRSDVRAVVEEAKALGATRIVIRTSQHWSNNRAIAELGLDVSDVTDRLGDVGEGASAYAAW